jgi:hypothetical protein
VLTEEEFAIAVAETHAVIEIRGGFTILEPNRKAVEEWASKIAASCRCSQELRELMLDRKAKPVSERDVACASESTASAAVSTRIR